MFESFRASFRRHVLLDCEVVREKDFRLVGDLVLDLSTKGMLVRARDRVLTGEEVIVSFRLPRSNDWFDAQGVVARVLHARRPSDCGVCLGIEFERVSRENEHLLFESLRGMSAPDPRRPPRPLAPSIEPRLLVRSPAPSRSVPPRGRAERSRAA